MIFHTEEEEEEEAVFPCSLPIEFYQMVPPINPHLFSQASDGSCKVIMIQHVYVSEINVEHLWHYVAVVSWSVCVLQGCLPCVTYQWGNQ